MTTLAELRERHKKLVEESNKKGTKTDGGNDFAQLQQGDNWVRILPGKEDPLEFYAETALHKFQDAEGKWRNYQCRKPHGEECPICEFYFDLWKRHKALNLPKIDGKSAKSKFGDLATKIKAKPRYYIKAVIRSLQEKDESPVKYIACSDELFNRIMAAMTNVDLVDDDNPDNTTIISLDRGNDFNIKITKKGEFNSFVESEPKIKKSKAGNPQEMLAWMESPLDIRSLVKVSDYEEGRKIAQILDASLNNVSNKPNSETGNESDEDNDKKFNKELKA
jgi:hypothetical protein